MRGVSRPNSADLFDLAYAIQLRIRKISSVMSGTECPFHRSPASLPLLAFGDDLHVWLAFLTNELTPSRTSAPPPPYGRSAIKM